LFLNVSTKLSKFSCQLIEFVHFIRANKLFKTNFKFKIYCLRNFCGSNSFVESFQRVISTFECFLLVYMIQKVLDGFEELDSKI